MLLPSIIRNNLHPVNRDSLFDNLFDFPMDIENVLKNEENALYGKNWTRAMKTDIREKEDGYTIHIDLPGMQKENISISLENGDLIVSAVKQIEKEKKNEDGKLIYSERHSGSMSRSFHVGEDIKEEDVHALFKDGVLSIDIPKKETVLPEKKLIAIEG